MGKIPSYAEALELVEQYNKEPFHIHHAKVVSGVVRWFAEKHDPERADYWAVVGLLHDIDYEQYPDEHCVKCREILAQNDIDGAIIDSVVSHGWGMTGGDIEPTDYMEKVLYAVDELTGLIGACAMVRPSKSVVDMETKSVKKKFKSPAFAAAINRDAIEKGAELMGVSLDELIGDTILAMRSLIGELDV